MKQNKNVPHQQSTYLGLKLKSKTEERRLIERWACEIELANLWLFCKSKFSFSQWKTFNFKFTVCVVHYWSKFKMGYFLV